MGAEAGSISRSTYRGTGGVDSAPGKRSSRGEPTEEDVGVSCESMLKVAIESYCCQAYPGHPFRTSLLDWLVSFFDTRACGIA